ncbi:MAG: hypothetical protein AB1Z98_34310 [Nannocystaceae bacterium]
MDATARLQRGPSASDLAALHDPIDAARSLPSLGPEWDAAVDMGIDVMMILRNRELPPYERFCQALEHQRFIDAVQRRTVPAELRAQRERERLREKIEALGGADPAWPESLRDGL